MTISHAGSISCRMSRDCVLVRGVGVGVQKRDHDGVDVELLAAPRRARAPPASSSGISTLPCVVEALVDLPAAVARDQRLRGCRCRPYMCGRSRRPSSSTSRKPRVVISAQRAPLALDHRIGGDRRAVQQRVEIARLDVGRAQRVEQRRDGSAGVDGTLMTRSTPLVDRRNKGR